MVRVPGAEGEKTVQQDAPLHFVLDAVDTTRVVDNGDGGGGGIPGVTGGSGGRARAQTRLSETESLQSHRAIILMEATGFRPHELRKSTSNFHDILFRNIKAALEKA